MKIATLGESVLKKPAQTVIHFDDALMSFVERLRQTMEVHKGIGIAAPQVFDSRAIMILAPRPNARYPYCPIMESITLINPEIYELANETEEDWEGCLSVPGIRGLVKRPTRVRFSYQDLKGEKHILEWQGFLARIFLHEYDHLLGKTWLDRIDNVSHIISEEVYYDSIGSDIVSGSK